MSHDQIRTELLAALKRVAPDVDTTLLKPDGNLRRQTDIDSIDYLRFMIEIHKRLNVAIPETDYARITTLDDCVRYIARRREEKVPSGA